MIKIRKCVVCKIKFKADTRELNRGQGKCCSRSCGATYANNNRKPEEHICVKCKKPYMCTIKNSKYCQKHSSSRGAEKLERLKLVYTDCFKCGWNLSTCDVHHIIPRRKGGTDKLSNLTVLCPNCHRLADRGILTDFLTVSDKVRTISSPNK